MRRFHLAVEIVIDDHDRVTIDRVSYEVRGKHDAPIAAEEVKLDAVLTEALPTKQEPNLSEASRNEVLTLLLSLGFDVAEGQKYMEAKTAARIKEVVRWIRSKKDVASPRKLAQKLLEQ